MKKTWILVLFIFCCSGWAQDQTTTTNTPSTPDTKSSYGPLPNPEIKFDLTAFPGYQTNEQVMRSAVIAYSTQYIALYKKEYVRTRGLSEKMKIFERTESREINSIKKMSAADLFKSTFLTKPEQLKKNLDAAALDLDYSTSFMTLKELHQLRLEFAALEKNMTESISDKTKIKASDDFATKAQLNQLKSKVDENEKLKILLYVLAILTVFSLGLSISAYKNS